MQTSLKIRHFALVFLGCSNAALAQGVPFEKPDIPTATERVSAIAHANGFAGEIVISDPAGITTDTVFGLADREHEKAHVKGQQWLWASVTKQITAMLVMQEVDRGTITLDDPIGVHLPAFGGDRSISVRELLQHRSGLPNPSDDAGENDIPAFYRDTGASIGNAARAAGFCSATAKGVKGGDFEYNNCDYLVLGAMLEKISGKAFDTLVAERVAGPLALGSLRVATDGAERGGAAPVGYDGDARFPALNVATYGAAGALTGSAADLAAIDQAFIAGRFLSAKAIGELWAGDPGLGYQALGVWSFPAKLAGCALPVALIERRGDVGGTQVRNVIAPELQRSVVVFTNDASLDFGEVWQGEGLTHDILAAAFCSAGVRASDQTRQQSDSATVALPAPIDLGAKGRVDLRP